jgi:hypothetical protein
MFPTCTIGHRPKEGENMAPEIEAKCGYDQVNDSWMIQISIPCSLFVSATDKPLAVGLADEFLKIAKERIETEKAKGSSA